MVRGKKQIINENSKMAADAKFTINEAVKANIISKISVSEELKKRFIGSQKATALLLLPASILVFAVVLGLIILFVSVLHFFVFSIKILLFVILCLLFPVFAVYNFFSTMSAIRKDDIEFYMGQIAGKTDKGYKVRGLEALDLNYLNKMKPATDPGMGDNVIIARIKDEYNLIAE